MLDLSGMQIALVAFTTALFIATSIGFSLKGGVRWVKVTTLVLLVSFAVTMASIQGVRPVLTTLAVMIGSTVTLIGLAFATWRMPITKTFHPAQESSCPQHARSKLDTWSEELICAGFSQAGDFTNAWRINGKDKLVFVRFLRHHSDPIWVELHVQEDPKIAARMAVSPTRQGSAVMTADQQSDQELLADPRLVVSRVPSGSSCAELVDAHRRQTATSGVSLEKVGDLPHGHVAIHSQWAEAAIQRGVGQRDGEFLRIKPAAIPATILRTFGAWLQ